MAFFNPRPLAICVAQALSHDHFFRHDRVHSDFWKRRFLTLHRRHAVQLWLLRTLGSEVAKVPNRTLRLGAR